VKIVWSGGTVQLKVIFGLVKDLSHPDSFYLEKKGSRNEIFKDF